MANWVLRALLNPKMAEGLRTAAAVALWVVVVFVFAAAWEMRQDLAGVVAYLGFLYDLWAAEPAKRGDIVSAVVSTLLLLMVHHSLLPKAPR